MHTRRRPGTRGLAALLIAILAGSLGAVAPAGRAAAQADPEGCLQLVTVDQNSQVQLHHAVRIPLHGDQLWPGGSPCVAMVLPDRLYTESVMSDVACGFMKIIALRQWTCASQLTAAQHFHRAAQGLGTDQFTIERTAWCGSDKPDGCDRTVPVPEPMPWQLAAARDLVDGMGLMRQALADPKAAPGAEDQAMALFAGALDRLAAQNAQ